MANIKQIQVGSTPYNIEPYTSYLKLNGASTMTGKLNLLASGANIGSNGIRGNSDSLPQDEAPQFVNTIDGFANGGRQKGCYVSTTLKSALAVPTINANTFLGVWNVAYQSAIPNIYYVKDSSDNYLWVKPYKFTESIPGGQIYLRNSHLVQSDEKKMGEWGYIKSSGLSQYYNYAATIKYVLYYDHRLTPSAKTSAKSTGNLKGNIFDDDSPLILFDSSTVSLVGTVYGENNKPYVYVGSPGTHDDYLELKVKLGLGEYNTSTQQMNGNLSIDYQNSIPNEYEDGAYNYQGNGVYIEVYDNARITLSKELYHYMCQKQLTPTVDTTVSPAQTEGAQISIGGKVYYQDVLDFNGTLISVDNGFNNEWGVNGPGVIDIPSISGSVDNDYGDFTFPSADMRYYKFRVVEKGCSSSSSTSLSEYADGYETIPYWFSTTDYGETRYNFTKEATISGRVYFSGASQPVSKTITNSSYPTVKAPVITGYIKSNVLNNAETSYIKKARFEVYNSNSFSVQATIGYTREGYSSVKRTATINSGRSYIGTEELPNYNYMEVEAFFTAYGIDSNDSYAEIENSTA